MSSSSSTSPPQRSPPPPRPTPSLRAAVVGENAEVEVGTAAGGTAARADDSADEAVLSFAGLGGRATAPIS